MSRIKLIKFNDEIDNYKLMYKWCKQEFIYEWFEQRILSFEEIVNKYKMKLINRKQDLFFICYNEVKIGFVQIYKYDDKKISELKDYKNIYEYDIFIGEAEYLSKGIGTKVVKYINNYIYDNYLSDCIVLRVFKRNIRAIKCYQKNNFKIIYEYEDKDTLGNNEKFLFLVNKNENNNLSV